MIIIKLIDTKYVSNLLSIVLQPMIDWLDDVLLWWCMLVAPPLKCIRSFYKIGKRPVICIIHETWFYGPASARVVNHRHNKYLDASLAVGSYVNVAAILVRATFPSFS